jgi:hypothetical protein
MYLWIHICSGGVGQFTYIYVLIAIPFKASRAAQIFRPLCNVHAVSYFACGVNDRANDTTCTMQVVSLTRHSKAVSHIIFTCTFDNLFILFANDTAWKSKKFELLRKFEFIFEKALAQGPRFFIKKPRIANLVTLFL